MSENLLESLVQSSVKSVLSKDRYSEKEIMKMYTSSKDIGDILANLTKFNMQYTNEVIFQVLTNLSDAGYLQLPDESE